MSTTLLQVSDAHFGTERPAVVAALRSLARDIGPDVVVLSGDITQRARRRQFAAAREFAEALSPARIIAIPGNHDIPLFDVVSRLLHPYGNYCRVFGPDLEPTHESTDLLVLTVNTTRPRRHKDGEVSAEQVARVAARLEQAGPRQLRIVVVHQPVLAVQPEDRRNVLHGRDDAVRRWAAAGVDLVLGGHIHLPYVRPLRQALPDLSRDAWTAQAGTSVSCRVRGGVPNSVNVVRTRVATAARGCVVERWDYSSADDLFRRVETHELSFE